MGVSSTRLYIPVPLKRQFAREFESGDLQDDFSYMGASFQQRVGFSRLHEWKGLMNYWFYGAVVK